MSLPANFRAPRCLLIKSEYAILDVLGRDGELYRRVRGDGAEIPVVIRGKIVRVFGDHDGVSREYDVEVESVDVP